MRQCLETGCPTLILGGSRCGEHASKVEARRTAHRRAEDRYGHAHRKVRAAWQLTVATGTVRCARCDQLIEPGQEWHLDHLPLGRTAPSHATCNIQHRSNTRAGA